MMVERQGGGGQEQVITGPRRVAFKHRFTERLSCYMYSPRDFICCYCSIGSRPVKYRMNGKMSTSSAVRCSWRYTSALGHSWLTDYHAELLIATEIHHGSFHQSS